MAPPSVWQQRSPTDPGWSLTKIPLSLTTVTKAPDHQQQMPSEYIVTTLRGHSSVVRRDGDKQPVNGGNVVRRERGTRGPGERGASQLRHLSSLPQDLHCTPPVYHHGQGDPTPHRPLRARGGREAVEERSVGGASCPRHNIPRP